jgi:phosphoglycolate phosphatase-like HAD superfamily hydrolase
VFIGDSATDVLAARAVGCAAIMIGEDELDGLTDLGVRAAPSLTQAADIAIALLGANDPLT